MVNITDIKKKAKELEKEHNINYFEALQRFMFERVLERISVSKYQDNFILKGGLLLTAFFGINNRTTKDMDAMIIGIDISKEKMINTLNEILNINLNDGVKFDIVEITDIREEDEYGGNKYHVVGRFQGLKVNLEIDISTGDKVTPKELNYKYPLLFEDKSILINSYNMETILAEKIETILRRGQFNSRMKDYYDIYFFIQNLSKKLNMNVLAEAIKNTFSGRASLKVLADYKEILISIESSSNINNLWNNYSIKYKYANNISLKEILKLLENLLNQIK